MCLYDGHAGCTLTSRTGLRSSKEVSGFIKGYIKYGALRNGINSYPDRVLSLSHDGPFFSGFRSERKEGLPMFKANPHNQKP